MVIFISTFYDVRMIFQKIIELTHSTIFFSQMNKQNLTIKNLNCDFLSTVGLKFMTTFQPNT